MLPEDSGPPRVRPMVSAGIELRIFNGGMRWLLQPYAAVEVWLEGRLVGTMSGTAVTRIVEHHLASASLAAAVQAELGQAEPTRKPPVPVDQRTALRARRRSRRRA